MFSKLYGAILVFSYLTLIAVAQEKSDLVTDAAGQKQFPAFEASDCKTCAAKKQVECFVCKGSKKADCLSCGGDQKAICGDCLGTGKSRDPYLDTLCPLCVGTAVSPCSMCTGSGAFLVEGGAKSGKCVCCDGKGGFKCTLCDGKRRIGCIKAGAADVRRAKVEDVAKAVDELSKFADEVTAFAFDQWETDQRNVQRFEKRVETGRKLLPELMRQHTSFAAAIKCMARSQPYRGHPEWMQMLFAVQERAILDYVDRQMKLLKVCAERHRANGAAGK